MVRKRFATVLCTIATAVGYVVGTYGELIASICKGIVERLTSN
jgi:hypothetical protein